MIGFWVMSALLTAGLGTLLSWQAVLEIKAHRLEQQGSIDQNRAENSAPQTARVIVLVTFALGLLAFLIYCLSGRPDLPGQAYAPRLAGLIAKSQRQPESLGAEEAIAVLKYLSLKRPREAQLQRLWGQEALDLGQKSEGIYHLQKAVTLAPGDVANLIAYGEARLATDNGQYSPQTLAVFQQVLSRDAKNPAARYYLGRAKILANDLKAGLEDWHSLMADLRADDPNHAKIASEIAAVQAGGAQALWLPSQAASDPDESANLRARAVPKTAIEAMVVRLAKRLGRHPNDPEGWVRLLRSYHVLHQNRAEASTWARIHMIFAQKPEIQAWIKQQAP